jgi:hypothetical protein
MPLHGKGLYRIIIFTLLKQFSVLFCVYGLFNDAVSNPYCINIEWYGWMIGE